VPLVDRLILISAHQKIGNTNLIQIQIAHFKTVSAFSNHVDKKKKIIRVWGST